MVKRSKTDIPVLTPDEIKKAFLKGDYLLDGKLKEDLSKFHIIEIEEMLPYIKFPNPPFKNTSHGFILLLEGDMTIQLDGLSYDFQPCAFILTPAGQINNFVRMSPDIQGFMGTFDDHYFNNDQLAPGIKAFTGLLNPLQLPHFQLDAELTQVFSSICQHLTWIYRQSVPKSSDVIANYLWALLSELEILFGNKNNKISSGSQRIILSFKELLVRTIRKNPRPSTLASDLNISANHLNKVLKKYTRHSTSEWITKRQVIEAQLLLKHSELTVTQIAQELSFGDLSYFSKIFLKHTGLSPSQYRKD